MPYHQAERIKVTNIQREEAQRVISLFITKRGAIDAAAYYRINQGYVSKIAHCLPCPGWAVMQVLRKVGYNLQKPLGNDANMGQSNKVEAVSRVIARLP